ncbi:MAG: enoyl-CoA hydratase/isomerase family protein [Solirubrobacteraceae bacterium]
MAEPLVVYEVAPTGVATLRLNHPARRNALSAELLAALAAALERAGGDPAVRCVVVASGHPTVFSAGADLAGFAGDRPLLDKHDAAAGFIRVFQLIGTLGKPTICAVDGAVLGGAVGVVLACDLVVASTAAVFGTPEIGVGAFPFMVMALMYRNVPRKKASELLLLGERISAEEARAAGIVNRVVAPDELAGAVGGWADRLAAASPSTMRLGKDAIHRQMDMALLDALEYLRSQLTIVMATDDLREGIDAFFERREPEWKGS